MIQTEREYGRALFAIAVEDNTVDEYIKALDSVSSVIAENPEYTDFLSSPAVPMSERLAALDEAFSDSLPENVLSFLKVLCENGRIRTVENCIKEFMMLSMTAANRTTAVITSAVELNEEQKAAMCKKLEKVLGKGIDPVYIIDESLIGGVKAEVDGKTFDGSIKHRLQEVKDVIIR